QEIKPATDTERPLAMLGLLKAFAIHRRPDMFQIAAHQRQKITQYRRRHIGKKRSKTIGQLRRLYHLVQGIKDAIAVKEERLAIRFKSADDGIHDVFAEKMHGLIAYLLPVLEGLLAIIV